MSGPLPPIEIDPRSKGAKADVWVFGGGGVVPTALNQVALIVTTGMAVTATNIGNPILIRDTQGVLPDVKTTIAGYTAATKTITLATNLTPAYISVCGVFGTDDSAAINKALLAAGFPHIWMTTDYAENHGSLGTFQGPTAPYNATSPGWWLHGSRVVTLTAKSRGSGMFGISNPIRVPAGATLKFQTPVHALANFPAGKGMVTNLLGDDGGVLMTGYMKLVSPHLIGFGLADYGVYAMCGNWGIDGGGRYEGFNLGHVVIGMTPTDWASWPVPASQGEYNAQASLGASLCWLNGLQEIHGMSYAGLAGWATNNPAGIGLWLTTHSVDCTVNADVWVEGVRTSVQDDGTNNKVHGTIHGFSHLYMGPLATVLQANSALAHYDRVLCDTPFDCGMISSVAAVLTALPANNDPIVVNGKTYTFQTVLTNVDGHVAIGATPTATAINLVHAIMASGGTPGTDYAAATTAHPTVMAYSNPLAKWGVLLYARTAGTAGNSYTLTTTSAAIYLSGATFSGGLNAAANVYGVQITGTGGAGGGGIVIGAIASVFNASGVDNQVILVKNAYTGTNANRIVNLEAGTANTSKKLAKVVSDPYAGANLVIDNISTDGTYYAFSDVTPTTTKAATALANANTANAALTAINAEIAALQSTTPGAAWTPQQLASSIALWADAGYGVTTDGSGNVTQWSPRIGPNSLLPTSQYVASGGIAQSMPTWAATAFDGASLPGVKFNVDSPSTTNQMLMFDNCIPSGTVDVSVFAVVKRGSMYGYQSNGNSERGFMSFPVNGGNGRFAMAFPESGSDNQTAVRFRDYNSNNCDAYSPPGFAVGASAILEEFAAADFTPVGGTSPTGGACQLNGFLVRNNTEKFANTGATTVSTTTNSGTAITIGASKGNPAGKYATTTVAEVIVLIGVLADADRQRILGYLAKKWFGSGTNILPTTNLYYNTGPVIAPGLTVAEVLQFVGTGDKSVSNTTVATSMIPTSEVGGMMIAAVQSAGKSARLYASGTYSTASSSPGNLTITVKIGSASFSATIATLENGANGTHWDLDIRLTFRTLGATGKVQVSGKMTSPGGLGTVILNNGGAPLTVNTTGSNLVDLAATWATASASNILVTKMAFLDTLN